jgi:two-component system LytT family sensor kinase
MDYYQSGNKFIEYVVDFPTSTILSITIILIFIQKIVPQFLVQQKNYFLFFISSLLLLTFLGTLDRIIGRFSAGKDLNSITNVLAYLKGGLYNALNMVGFPLMLLLIKKFYEGQQVLVETQKQQKENELKLLRSQINPHFLFNNLNTLDSLVDKYLIKTKDAEVMELANKIELAKNYIFLIQTRFGNDYESNIEKNISLADKFIPSI